MKKWHGTIRIKSNFKSNHYYTTVLADSLDSAIEKAKNKFLSIRNKNTQIIEIKLSELL